MDPSIDDVRQIVREMRTVAVLGAHPSRMRPAFYVPDYLHGQGLRIVPVNGRYEGDTLWGEIVRSSLPEVDGPVDVVDVFRRADALGGHEAEILAMEPLPKVVWFQSGIRNDEVAGRLRAGGITVVQDRCLLVDHRNMVPGL